MKRLLVYILLAGCCVLLQSCGSSKDPIVGLPVPQIAITAPANGATVTSLPATLSVSFANGADPTMMKAVLDGIDITSQFGPAGANGVRSATVNRPAVNIGNNQLQITDGSLLAQSSFAVSPVAPGAPTGSLALPLLVPIQTRYMTGDGSHNGDYNIALFADPNNPTTPTALYPAPNATANEHAVQGLQILVLSRIDLHVVENVLVSNEVPPQDGLWSQLPLYNTLIDIPSQCGSAGCLLIMQSLLNLGYTPCSVIQTYSVDCLNLSVIFQSLGASTKFFYANGAVLTQYNAEVACSFIGNINQNTFANTPTGAYFERLTCSGANSTSNPRLCDSLAGYAGISSTAPAGATPGQVGNMSGALVRDNYLNYTYVQNAPMVAFSSAIDPINQGQNFPSHAFTINGQTYWSNFPTSAPFGGFHLVILDRTTLALVTQQTWPAQSDASELVAISQLLGNYNTNGYLIFLAAFGDTTYTPNTNNRAVWVKFAGGNPNVSALSNPPPPLPPYGIIPALGGTPQVFYLMNNQEHCQNNQICQMDDYTLVGGFIEAPVSGRK